jgi:hypothetical protein
MTDHNKVLYAYYDLNVSPLSYDFIGYLVVAELYRRQNGYSRMHLVIVPFEEGLGQWNHTLLGNDHTMWRLTNIVIPLSRVIPSCSGFTFCSSRQQAADMYASVAADPGSIYPAGYTVEDPVEKHHTGWSLIEANRGENLQFVEPVGEAKNYARQWIEQHAEGKKCVVLTLREARFTHANNSSPRVWGEFAQWLKQEGYFPVVLRDIDTALKKPPRGFEGITFAPESVFNLELRLALYEEAYACAFVANGPAQVCFYNKNVRFLYMVTGDWLDQKPTPFERIGIGFDTTPPFANKFQRWIWKEQETQTLIDEFQALVQSIDESEQAGTYEADLLPLVELQGPPETVANRCLNFASSVDHPCPEEIKIARAAHGPNAPEDLYIVAEHMVEVDQALRDNDLLRAELHLTEMDKHGGLNAKYSERFAMVKEALGKFSEAVEFYRRAIQEGNDGPGVAFRLAIAFKNNSQPDAAIGQLESMIARGAHSMYVTYELGQLYAEHRSVEEALSFYDKWRAEGISNAEIEAHRAALQPLVSTNN